MKNIIANLPDQAKRSVLFSLVGSLNASIVGQASSVASRLARDDQDFRDLEPRDVVHMMNDIDDSQSALLTARRTLRVRHALHAQLVEVSNKEEDGALSSTIDFMTNPPKGRKIDTEMLKAALEAAGLAAVDPKHFEALQKMNDVQRAERLAAQRGAIEWIIEHVFDGRGYDTYDERDGTPKFVDESDNDELSALPEEQQQRLQEKMLSALNKARDNTVLGVLNRDRRYTFGNLPLIAAAIRECEALH